jgi:hypothetical protein
MNQNAHNNMQPKQQQQHQDELGCVDEYLAHKAPIPHIWPLSACVAPWRMGADYLWQTKKVRVRASVVLLGLKEGVFNV